jgi:hypothetical protein
VEEAVAVAGETGRVTFDAAGDEDLTVLAGELGREDLAIPDTEGLAGRGTPPTRRATWAGGAGVSGFVGLLGPATRRSRSSNCVLSLGESDPTRDHIFSPTSE